MYTGMETLAFNNIEKPSSIIRTRPPLSRVEASVMLGAGAASKRMLSRFRSRKARSKRSNLLPLRLKALIRRIPCIYSIMREAALVFIF